MKLSLLLLSCGLLFCESLNAQPPSLKKTTNSEKLIAVVNYDYQASTSGFIDSTRVIYSGSRGSKFEFDNLRYDWNNSGDFPPFSNRLPPYEDRIGNIAYDSLLTYYSPSSSTYTVTGSRTYDALGRIVDSRIGALSSAAQRTLFYYSSFDSSLSVTKDLYYKTSLQKWDTPSYTSYIFSNGAFYKDVLLNTSLFIWSGTKWAQNSTNAYISGNGIPQIEMGYRVVDTSKFPQYINEFRNRGASSALVWRKHKTYRDTAFVNRTWDVFDYTGDILTLIQNYSWDTTGVVLILKMEEYRHLNNDSLVDSVLNRTYNGVSWDTSIQKLSYTSAGNPVSLRKFNADGETLLSETRWYYEVTATGIAPEVSPNDLLIYPSPTNDKIYFRCSSLTDDKKIRVTNSSGQCVIARSAKQAEGIDVSALPAGLYVFQIWDAHNKCQSKVFQKL